ncbi:MAG: IS200/IS605 family transposase [Phycisphaeraceae bacterium]|nr:IS200/IS605 family transposase [Phycisphaeraceae bacterium]
MATTITKILLHITYSTKQREPLIDTSDEGDLYAYIGGICRNLRSPLLDMGGTADHLNMLVSISKTIALADLMLNIKRDSSAWMNARPGRTHRFAWQEGYFAFSIGESGVEDLSRYIARQKAHRKKIDFKDEVRSLLTKYKMSWNEEHMWD